jgi:type I restriction enzyme R subunit
LYAATEEQEEPAQGLKRITSEVPVLDERYQRLLQFFDANKVRQVDDFVQGRLTDVAADTEVVHAAVKLLADDFIEKLNQHADGNFEAKASEMEHAIRKHCTVHHNEDPAFYKNLSEKVEKLIEQYKGQWELLAEELEKLRAETITGRETGEDGMSREAATFYAHIANEAFADGKIPDDFKAKMKVLMEAIVDTLQESIGSIDYWNNADKQKRTRSEIKTALMLTGIEELKQNRERVAVEIMKLAKNRHDALLKGSK